MNLSPLKARRQSVMSYNSQFSDTNLNICHVTGIHADAKLNYKEKLILFAISMFFLDHIYIIYLRGPDLDRCINKLQIIKMYCENIVFSLVQIWIIKFIHIDLD